VTRAQKIDLSFLVLVALALWLVCVLLNGCAPAAFGTTVGAPVDSTRWVEANGKLRPYAVTWADGRLNVWTYDTPLHHCSWFNDGTEVLPFDAAWRADLPFGWASGSVIAGSLTAWHSDDDSVRVLDGGLTATCHGDTLDGVLTARVVRTCDVLMDSIPFRLVRVP